MLQHVCICVRDMALKCGCLPMRVGWLALISSFSLTDALRSARSPTVLRAHTDGQRSATWSRRQLAAATSLIVGGGLAPPAPPASASSSGDPAAAARGPLIEVTDPDTYSALAYAPPPATAGRKPPLLVVLHGAGKNEQDAWSLADPRGEVRTSMVVSIVIPLRSLANRAVRLEILPWLHHSELITPYDNSTRGSPQACSRRAWRPRR